MLQIPIHLRCLALLFLLFTTVENFAQRDFSKVEIETQKLTDNIYMLLGSGGNIGVCVGEDGVLMIDDQYAPLSEKIKAAIQTLSKEEITYLINTHWHGDHSGGNENFAKAGATIVAHKNVRARLSNDQLMKAFSRTVPAAPEAAWPVITFSSDMTLHFNNEDIIIHHVHNAHTDGDAIIYFSTSNVMHLGDTYFKGRFPFIDLGSGGSINGIIEAADKAIFLADEETQIIPGHGALSNRAELMEYRNVLITIRDRVKTAMDTGKDIEAIKAAKLTADYDETWGSGFINGDRLVDFIFTSLSR